MVDFPEVVFDDFFVYVMIAGTSIDVKVLDVLGTIVGDEGHLEELVANEIQALFDRAHNRLRLGLLDEIL